LFSEWSKLLIEDDVFEGEDDEDKWMVDDTNVTEVIEALNYNHDDWLLEDEVLEMIPEDQS
jgi:hypothetical protein